MSIEHFNQFQKELMQNSALQEQLKAVVATSPEKLGKLAVKLGAERGYSFTLEEIQQTEMEAASSYPGVGETLRDEELEMVSGGLTPTVVIVGTVASRVATAPVAIAQQENAEDEEGEDSIEESAKDISGS